MDLPCSHVRVCIYIVVLGDVCSRLISRRVAGHHFGIRVLVDADVIYSHRCWHQWGQTSKVEGRETIRHAKVDYH